MFKWIRILCSSKTGLGVQIKPEYAILDEFQYVPELIPAIKQVSDHLALLKQSTWSDEPVALWHFRDNHQNEVDIVSEST